MRSASPTTLPLVRGRVDTIVDRLQTLHYGSRNHTFALYRQKLDDIRSKLNECRVDVPTPLAHETAQLLQALFRDLPTAHNAVLYGGQSIPPYAQDWAAFYPEIKQYIRFILNRLHEVSDVPDGAYHVPDDHATAPTVAVHRPPPQPHVTRTASQPSAYSQTQPPPFIPPPEYMRAAQVPRAANFPAAPQRVPVVGHRSMPVLGVPATGVHRVPPHYGPQCVVPRSPGSFYPVAPVPPHLAHMYANSPVLGSARY